MKLIFDGDFKEDLSIMSIKYITFFLWVSFLSSPVLALFEAEEIVIARTRLCPQVPFTQFDIRFSENELENLRQLSITHEAEYENFGTSLDQLEMEADTYFKSLGSNESSLTEPLARMVSQITQKVMEGFGLESAWVALRASVPNKLYDVPRWHQDGPYISSHDGDQQKVVITFKGLGTLFCSFPEELREVFDKLQDEIGMNTLKTLDLHDAYNMERRYQLDALIKGSKASVHMPSLGTGSIFIAGTEYAAVHSEPPVGEIRLFMSIFPCTIAQAEELKSRRSKQ